MESGPFGLAHRLLTDPDDLGLCRGRLTLTPSLAVTTADVTSATLFFTPYKGNGLDLFDGRRWTRYKFPELSFPFISVVSGTIYDAFVVDRDGLGRLTLELVAWTNDTTRATAIVLQDGLYVKDGARSRRYLGAFKASATNTAADTRSQRLLSNYYNRVRRFLYAQETTDTWTYAIAAYRAANAVTTVGVTRVEILQGVAEDYVEAEVLAMADMDIDEQSAVGIGLDSTTVDSSHAKSQAFITGTAARMVSHNAARYRGVPAAGYHFLQWLEYSPGGLVTSYWGDAGVAYIMSGLTATVMG